jgi:valyl-tRNA synthetase
MSKSLGTGIDPLDLIDGGPRPPVFPQGGEFPAYGADAVRFGLLAMSSTQDVRFSEEKIEQGRALANKLFNASRFVLLQVDADAQAAPRPRTIEDRWMLSRLQRAKAEFEARVDGFDFAKAALGLYEFVFDELCDWYLEMVKPRLYGDDEAAKADVSATLLHVVRETLALAHPIIPFVTEEVWSLLPEGVRGDAELLAGARFPAVDPALLDDDAEAAVTRAIGAVTAVRGWRDRVGVRPGAVLPARLPAGYEEVAALVAALGRLDLAGGDGAAAIAGVAVPGGAVDLLPSDEVDLEAARARVAAERERLRGEIRRAEGKLANERFVAKAPEAVVQEERDKLTRLQTELDQLQDV